MTARSVSASRPMSDPPVSRPSGRVTRTIAAALDHVIVRQHEAIGREDDARPAASRDLDAHDRRADRLDSADHRLRIGVEQFDVGQHVRFPGS